MRFHESKSQCAIISLKAVLSPLIILSSRHAHLAMIINELLRSSTGERKEASLLSFDSSDDMSAALFVLDRYYARSSSTCRLRLVHRHTE